MECVPKINSETYEHPHVLHVITRVFEIRVHVYLKSADYSRIKIASVFKVQKYV